MTAGSLLQPYQIAMIDAMTRWYRLFVRAATALFLLQLVHLVWLTLDVVIFRLTGFGLFPTELDILLALVDYTEIPALVGVSLVYFHEIALKKATAKTWLYLGFLASQLLHIFWITDEVIIKLVAGEVLVVLPAWLAWVAIAVDYLEIPVMVDTTVRALNLKIKNQN